METNGSKPKSTAMTSKEASTRLSLCTVTLRKCLWISSSLSIKFFCLGFHIIGESSKIDLTKEQYCTLRHLVSLKSEQFRFKKPINSNYTSIKGQVWWQRNPHIVNGIEEVSNWKPFIFYVLIGLFFWRLHETTLHLYKIVIKCLCFFFCKPLWNHRQTWNDHWSVIDHIVKKFWVIRYTVLVYLPEIGATAWHTRNILAFLILYSDILNNSTFTAQQTLTIYRLYIGTRKTDAITLPGAPIYSRSSR